MKDQLKIMFKKYSIYPDTLETAATDGSKGEEVLETQIHVCS